MPQPILSPLDIGRASDPTAPTIETVSLYSFKRAEQMRLRARPEGEVAFDLAPSLSTRKQVLVTPSSGTAYTVLGGPAMTNVGTAAHPALNTTDLRQSTHRTTITSAATAGSASQIRQGVLTMWRGNAAGLGGFMVSSKFAISSTVSGQRVAVGLLNSVSAIAVTQEPNALTNCIFFGWGTGDSNAQIMRNDATGTCTKIDLGSNFPINTPSHVYDFTLFCYPNSADVHYHVINLTTGNEASGTLSTDLPANTLFLAWHAYANNNGVAQAVVIDFIRMYAELPL